jgi:hypothetical protein
MGWHVVATLLLIGWGGLAFGAVYPWAYIPLFAGCAALGVALLLWRGRRGRLATPVVIGLGVVLAAIALQLVPVPIETIRSVTPATDDLLRQYELGYDGSAANHPFSIDPRATTRALGAAAALAVFVIGLGRVLSHNDTGRIARGIGVLGVIIALAGIVQAALWNGKIYGFWTPQERGESFGPFVNRNHFAGWMLMALPLVVGYFSGRVARGMRDVRPGWRNRIIWFSSADASETIWIGFSALMMAVALVLTTSRSGVIGLLTALVVAAWFTSRRQSGIARRVSVVGYLIVVAVIAIGWTGFDRLAARFSAGAGTLGGRLGLLTDTWRLATHFPLVGTGLNTFGTAMVFNQTVEKQLHYREAHNDYLQLMSDGGVLLCVPVVLAIVACAVVVRRRFREAATDSSDYWIRLGAVTGVLAVSVQEIFDFSLQIPGNAVLFGVLIAIALRFSSHRDQVPRGPQGVLIS